GAGRAGELRRGVEGGEVSKGGVPAVAGVRVGADGEGAVGGDVDGAPGAGLAGVRDVLGNALAAHRLAALVVVGVAGQTGGGGVHGGVQGPPGAGGGQFVVEGL